MTCALLVKYANEFWIRLRPPKRILVKTKAWLLGAATLKISIACSMSSGGRCKSRPFSGKCQPFAQHSKRWSDRIIGPCPRLRSMHRRCHFFNSKPGIAKCAAANGETVLNAPKTQRVCERTPEQNPTNGTPIDKRRNFRRPTKAQGPPANQRRSGTPVGVDTTGGDCEPATRCRKRTNRNQPPMKTIARIRSRRNEQRSAPMNERSGSEAGSQGSAKMCQYHATFSNSNHAGPKKVMGIKFCCYDGALPVPDRRRQERYRGEKSAAQL